jgi:ribonuclease HI
MAKKFYVVWNGRSTGIFGDWATTHPLIDGHPGARYKSFATRTEAEQAFRAGAPAQRKPGPRAANKATSTESDIGAAAFDTVIFCDGACEPNPGKAGSGMAVYRDGSLTELWHGLYNPAGTNNTAELSALHQALLLAQTEIDAGRTVQVRSDSSYGLNAVTKWAIGWEKRGWRKADGEIKNLALIQKLYALYLQIKEEVNLEHVSAHVGIEGNELADRMAMLAVERRELQWLRYAEPLDVAAILRMRAG